MSANPREGEDEDTVDQSAAMLTVREAAVLLRVSKASIYSMIHSGTLKAGRVGGRRGAIRIRSQDLMNCVVWMENSVHEEPPPVVRRPTLKHIRLSR
ncbi:MAG: helix-turn-helix domain-containing protein [Planctomycetaceae bacterium]|nr:helix-turn-helix domain-containing protein [Planctomycetaceae bacterium]